MLTMTCPICGTELQKDDPYETVCCSGCGFLWIGGGVACSDE